MLLSHKEEQQKLLRLLTLPCSRRGRPPKASSLRQKLEDHPACHMSWRVLGAWSH